MTETAPQEFTFQAEIKQLLHLLSHSLYQNREIAIRELISNASDALDKFRHLTLTNSAIPNEAPLEITLEPNEPESLLVIRDNGLGMTHDELVKNLGTIAHSGSLEFLRNTAQQGKDAASNLSLIGQFGVGFYSAFMLADKVEVLSRSYQSDEGWKWESDGSGRFTVEPQAGLSRGTQIRLHLKSDLKEFTQPWRLKSVLKQYSTFVPHPIKLGNEVVNDQKPIWVEPKSKVTDEEYQKFFEHLTHGIGEKPLWHLHLTADSPFQFHSILYCSETNVERMGFGRAEHGVQLCAKRILVQHNCRELLPDYLRFLHGLVDSADLPLNVSREALQDNTVFRKIKKVLTKKILSHLESIATERPNDYLTFYRQFGITLREGLHSDFEHREEIASLLRFASSALPPETDNPEPLTGFADYVKRIPEGQNQIYFVGGPDRKSLEKNPNLEIFRRKKLEVLFVTDPVDEFVLSNLRNYQGKDLVAIDSSQIEFPPASDADKADEAKAEEQQTAAAESSAFQRVLELFREELGGAVSEVRASKRLTDSVCCLVNPEGSMSAQLQKVLSMGDRDLPPSKKILEVNPSAPLIARLSGIADCAEQAAFIKQCGRQLFANALLLEGVPLDPAELVSRVQGFMLDAAAAKSDT
ncbi:MAG: molecular chaperone HtpG [Planctomycetes bacterium]|nr:molecular chaperone HtpG [Planctomycetota bacterium]